MLCYAVLCYAMNSKLCFAMLCYARLFWLCYAMPCHAMPCNALPCYAMLCCVMLCYGMLVYTIKSTKHIEKTEKLNVCIVTRQASHATHAASGARRNREQH